MIIKTLNILSEILDKTFSYQFGVRKGFFDLLTARTKLKKILFI